MPIASRTSSCIHGCTATSTTASIPTPGCITTWTSRSAGRPRNRGRAMGSRHSRGSRNSATFERETPGSRSRGDDEVNAPRRTLLKAAMLAPLGAALGARAADATKTIRTAFIVAETGFDPQATSDLYSDSIQRAIFETLFGFDYLARPYKRVPRTAVAMPEITGGGKLWTIKIKPGIHFADDPAFKGRKRELTANDYVYAWKRLLDPRIRSPFAWYVQGKIVGADDVIAAAGKSGRFDYDAPIHGLRALDRYTLRLELNEADYIMLGYMTQSPMAAVAREVIEAYGDVNGSAMDHPVGTGAYMFKSWRRGQQIVL